MSKRFWKNVALIFLGCVVVFNIAAFKILQAYIYDRGKGLIRLGVDGIHLTRLEYQKADQSVLLIGMMHIADERFFKSVVNSIPVAGSIVLLEGVTDKERVSGKALDYRTLARWLRTSYQDKSFDQDIKATHEFRYADVDVKDLSAESRRFLELLGREDEWSERVSTVMDDDFDEEGWDRAETSFQADRNRKLLQTFDEVAGAYTVVAIPWGVSHIKTFQKELEHRSFELVGSQEVLALGFW